MLDIVGKELVYDETAWDSDVYVNGDIIRIDLDNDGNPGMLAKSFNLG